MRYVFTLEISQLYAMCWAFPDIGLVLPRKKSAVCAGAEYNLFLEFFDSTRKKIKKSLSAHHLTGTAPLIHFLLKLPFICYMLY